MDRSSDSSQDPESPSSSMDAEQGMFEKYKYGVTPPANPRERKLSKERIRDSRKKCAKDVFKAQRPYTGRRSYERTRSKNAVSAETVLSSLSIEDDDQPQMFYENQSSPPDSARKRSRDQSKNFTTSRAYDRDFKFSASDLTAMDDARSMPAILMQPIDTKSRYLSLKPVSADSERTVDAESKPVNKAKHRLSLNQLECPPDRYQFYKTFSMLIKLGNSKKDKDKDIGGKPDLGMPFARQMSSEQIEFWQNHYNDLIWLEPQAYHWDRSMADQDAFLLRARDLVPRVLEEVLTFKLEIPRLVSLSFLDLDDGMLDGDVPINSIDGIIDHETQTSASEPNLHRCVRNLEYALEQVEALLDRLEKIESLYPSHKAIGRDYTEYASEEFQLRVDTLCLWTNITRDLGRKVGIIAKVLGVDQIKGLTWPWMKLDFQSSESNTSLAPDICIQDVDEDGDDEDTGDEDEYSSSYRKSVDDAQKALKKIELTQNGASPASSTKNVRFDISDSTPSTPEAGSPIAKSPQQRSSSFVPKSPSRASLTHQTSTSIYRSFVDKTLRKMGLKKAQARLPSILHGTLIRARCALNRSKKGNQPGKV